MNRREAMMALFALPCVTRVSTTPVKTTDVIVIESEGYISHETAFRIEDYAKKAWPEQKVIVLTQGLKMSVVAGA